MFIKTLSLQNFRNFSKKEFSFSEGTTIILGKNTTGKTNTLEAIYLLSTGKSFRAFREDEMIAQGREIGRIVGLIETESEKVDLELVLVREGEEVRGGKRLMINGVSRRLFNFAGTLKVVLFGPWDVSMVTDPPSVRRRFLDGVLSQTDREYRRSLLSYEKGVRQRNRVLERIREGLASRAQLLYWDHLVIREGNYITGARSRFVEFVNTTSFPGENFSLEYDQSVVSEGRLAQYKEEEVLAATTLVGPHRDDIVFRKKGKVHSAQGWELSKFGSRGEQRMAVLWAKLAELEFIARESGERPVLLLDDIFSELDPDHHQLVLETTTKQQTILTMAEPREVAKNAHIIELMVKRE